MATPPTDSAPNLNWLVNEQKIAPYVPLVEKSKREDGTFSRADFSFDKERDIYICPAGKVLTTTGKVVTDDQLLYRARKRDYDACPLKMQCCPKEPMRKVTRRIYEEARDVARAHGKTKAYERSRRDRKKVDPTARRAQAGTGVRARSVRRGGYLPNWEHLSPGLCGRPSTDATA